MSRAAHVAVVSAITRQNKKQNEFTDISTASAGGGDISPSNSIAVGSDGQPLWPWNPKRPEKYSTDRAGLPKRNDLSTGLKLRKACGIILMVVVIFGLAIAIFAHLSNSNKDSQEPAHTHRDSNNGTDIVVSDNSSGPQNTSAPTSPNGNARETKREKSSAG